MLDFFIRQPVAHGLRDKPQTVRGLGREGADDGGLVGGPVDFGPPTLTLPHEGGGKRGVVVSARHGQGGPQPASCKDAFAPGAGVNPGLRLTEQALVPFAPVERPPSSGGPGARGSFRHPRTERERFGGPLPDPIGRSRKAEARGVAVIAGRR